MRQDGSTLGASANLSVVRRDALLRFVAKPSRERSCANQPPSGRRIGGARGTLAVLLSRRRIRGIL